MQSNKNLFWLKILSVLVAFLVWLLVYNISDSLVSDSKVLNVEITNEDNMEQMGLAYDLNGKTTAKISYTVRSNERSKINESDFRVYIDFTEFTVAGAVPLHYEILNGKEEYIKEISIEPSVIKVNTEEIISKQFTLTAGIKNSPKENYEVHSVDMDVNTVEVTGPVSEIGRISGIGIELDVDDISSVMEGKTNIIYYDANENKIELDKVRANINNITYKVNLNKTKEVPVKFKIVGEPAEDVYYTSNSMEPDRIKIKGSIELIDSISIIDGGLLDISGKTDSYIETVNLASKVPEGITLVDVDSIKVHVNMLRIEKETEESSSEESSSESSDGSNESTSSSEIGPGSLSDATSSTSESTSESTSDESTKESGVEESTSGESE